MKEYEDPTMYILPLDDFAKSKYDVHGSDDEPGFGPLQ